MRLVRTLLTIAVFSLARDPSLLCRVAPRLLGPASLQPIFTTASCRLICRLWSAIQWREKIVMIQANTIRRTPYRWLPAVALLSQRLKPSLRIRICLSPAKHSSQCFPQKPPLGGFCLSALSRLLHQPHLLVEDRSDLLQGSYGKAMHPGFHPSDHRLRHVGFRRHLFLGHSLFSSEAFKVESNVDTGYFLKIGFLESRFFALFFDEGRKRNESEAPYYFFTFFLHSRLYIFSARSIMRTGVFLLCFFNISTT